MSMFVNKYVPYLCALRGAGSSHTPITMSIPNAQILASKQYSPRKGIQDSLEK